jgi:hypothetical protein
VQEQLDPAFYGESPPKWVDKRTGRPAEPDAGNPNIVRYQGTNRPNPDAPVHVNLRHEPAVPHPGTPETATQSHLFPTALDAAGEWAPHSVPEQTGKPTHVGSDVELGPSMSPRELHDFVQRLDKDVWETASQQNPERPQQAIDANPDLKFKQQLAGVAAERLAKTVGEVLGPGAENWFRQNNKSFSRLKALESPLLNAANKQATGAEGARSMLSPYTWRHALPVAGLKFGGMPGAIAGGLADVGVTLTHKYGKATGAKMLQGLSDTLYKVDKPTTEAVKAGNSQYLIQQYMANRLREKKDKEKKNAP